VVVVVVEQIILDFKVVVVVLEDTLQEMSVYL
jgi:hypothetical protein